MGDQNSACRGSRAACIRGGGSRVSNMGQGMLDRVAGWLKLAVRAAAVAGLLLPGSLRAQSIRVPWSDYAHDPQHTAISPVASQPLHRVIWQTSVDLSVP